VPLLLPPTNDDWREGSALSSPRKRTIMDGQSGKKGGPAVESGLVAKLGWRAQSLHDGDGAAGWR
jgi:hypothetical protein